MIAEIISIGNELLIGKVLNTNAQWLCRRLTSLGINVKRITVVPDDLNEISNCLNETILRKPNYIFTTGGLGPTFDDMTLKAFSNAFNLELILNEEALKMVSLKIEELAKKGIIKHKELTPYRLKMASLPKGSKPLPNPVGTAPGVYLFLNNCEIYILPGVPDEMKVIFEESIFPRIKEKSKLKFIEKSLRLIGIAESDLSPIIEQAMKNNPGIYIKSHPKHGEGTSLIELHFSTMKEEINEGEKIIDKAIEEISSQIIKKGVSIEEIS